MEKKFAQGNVPLVGRGGDETGAAAGEGVVFARGVRRMQDGVVSKDSYGSSWLGCLSDPQRDAELKWMLWVWWSVDRDGGVRERYRDGDHGLASLRRADALDEDHDCGKCRRGYGGS